MNKLVNKILATTCMLWITSFALISVKEFQDRNVASGIIFALMWVLAIAATLWGFIKEDVLDKENRK